MMKFGTIKYGLLLFLALAMIQQAGAQQVIRAVKPIQVSGYRLDVSDLSKNEQEQLKEYLSRIPKTKQEAFDLDVRKIMETPRLSREDRSRAVFRLAERYVMRRVTTQGDKVNTPDQIIKPNTPQKIDIKPSSPVVVETPDPSPPETRDPEANTGAALPDEHVELEDMVPDEEPAAEQIEEASLFRKISSHLQGRLTYDVPDSMRVAETFRVKLAVSSGKLDATVLAAIENPKNPQFATIRIGNKMKAELLDYDGTSVNPNFHIERLGGFEEQTVQTTDSMPTLWERNVVPLKPGEHSLQVKVSVITFNETTKQNDYMTLIPSFTREVRVIAVAVPKKRPSRIAFFVVLGGAILLSVVLLVLLLRPRRSQAKINRLALAGDVPALIELGELDAAIEEMKKKAASAGKRELEKEILSLDSRLSQLQREVNQGIISKPDEIMERNKITVALIHLFEELAEQSV